MAIPGFPSLDQNLQPIDQFKWKMILSSRAKLSDLYTLSQSKLLENHTLHSGTYPYSLYMAVPPPPNGSIFASFNAIPAEVTGKYYG